MSNNTVKKDDALSNHEIKQLLLKILEKERMENFQIEEKAFTYKGDNYMSMLFSIKITDASKQLHLILKKEIDNEEQRDEIRKVEAFDKELFVYNVILPFYEKIQKAKGMSLSDGFYNYPKIYGSNEGCLFLEDLRRDGYQMSDRFQYPDFNHMKLAIEMLARFHAVGFDLKQNKPEVIDEFRKKIPEMLFRRSYTKFYVFLRMAFDSALTTLEDEEQALKDKVLDLKFNLEDKIDFFLDQESGEPYSTITHGDFWNNNVLYKYENGKPVHIRVVDYQLCRYCSPAVDLAYYIFCCTDQQFRDEHYMEILRIYHGSLSESMQKLGSDASKVFPFKVLEEHMQRFGAFGLISAAFMLRIIFSKGEDIFDSDKYSKVGNEDGTKTVQFISAEETFQKYKKEMSSVIRDIVRRGML